MPSLLAKLRNIITFTWICRVFEGYHHSWKTYIYQRDVLNKTYIVTLCSTREHSINRNKCTELKITLSKVTKTDFTCLILAWFQRNLKKSSIYFWTHTLRRTYPVSWTPHLTNSKICWVVCATSFYLSSLHCIVCMRSGVMWRGKENNHSLTLK